MAILYGRHGFDNAAVSSHGCLGRIAECTDKRVHIAYVLVESRTVKAQMRGEWFERHGLTSKSTP